MMKLMFADKWTLDSPSTENNQEMDFAQKDTGHGQDDITVHAIYTPLATEETRLWEFMGNDSASSNISTMFPVSEGNVDDGNGTGVTLLSTFLEGNNEYIFDRSDVRLIFLILYTIVFSICFFGNLMVILVVTLHWRMRSITNFCLANLAFADLCVGIFCVYQNLVTYLMDSWIFGEFMCKMYHFINSLSTTASVLILVVICIERYLAIIHPMTCKQMMTLNRLRITIVLVWILSAAISSPRFYYFSTISMTLPDNQVEILCLPNRTKYNSKLMDMISMTVLFLIPLSIITVLYTQIGIALWKSSRNRMPASSTPSASFESSTSSGAYFHREADQNIIEAVKLTLLPVAVNTNDSQLDQLCLQEPPFPHSCPGNKPKKAEPIWICLPCRRKRKQRKSSEKGGCAATPSPIGSRPCMANVAINGANNVTTNVVNEQAHYTRTGPSVRILSARSSSFPSPPCCLGDERNTKLDPIVLVKFEKTQSGRKGESRCTILMNTQSYRGENRPRESDNEINGGEGEPSGLHHQNNSLQKLENSGIRGIFRKSNIEGVCHDQNFDRRGTTLSTCGASCLNGQPLGTCRHRYCQLCFTPSAPKRIKRMRVIRSSKNGIAALQSRRRIIRMLIVVVLAFALCHLPFHARKVWQYWSPPGAWQYQAGSVFSTLFTPFTFLIMYANSAVNPILYAFMSKKFRMSCNDLIRCKIRASLRINRNASVRSTHVAGLSSHTAGTGL